MVSRARYRWRLSPSPGAARFGDLTVQEAARRMSRPRLAVLACLVVAWLLAIAAPVGVAAKTGRFATTTTPRSSPRSRPWRRLV